MGTIITFQEANRRVQELTGNRISILSESDYHAFKRETTLVCNSCHAQWQTTPHTICKPRKTKHYNPCPNCGDRKKWTSRRLIDHINDQFANEGKFELRSEYIREGHEVLLYHHECDHEFRVTARSCFDGKTCCPICNDKIPMDGGTFIQKLNKKYPKDGEYILDGPYEDTHSTVRIYHRNCQQDMMVIPHSVLDKDQQHCCYYCFNASHGERAVHDYLKVYGMSFQEQVSFEGCKDIKVLSFDFILYSKDQEPLIAIEYQGRQHLVTVYNSDQLTTTQRHDRIKKQYCDDNGIQLIYLYEPEKNRTSEDQIRDNVKASLDAIDLSSCSKKAQGRIHA
ncbi:DUF2726 domain-containing protein [Lentilactobacillus sunkii]|nr:DUF2726 domain-containing protein [Lentilactobacillus sunkii]